MLNKTHYFVYLLFVLGILISSCENKQVKAKEVENTDKNSTKVEEEKMNENTKFILFYGNSLTAGYGLDEEYSFPSLIQDKLDDASLDFKVINAGLSGETTAGGKTRIDWVLKQDVDIFVLELGANDMLRGIDVKNTKDNLQAIIDKVRAKNSDIQIILAGMKAAPNMGEEYVKAFDGLYTDLAKANDISLIPFLLDKVAGIPELNLADGKHPNAEGQKIVMMNVWEVLKEFI